MSTANKWRLFVGFIVLGLLSGFMLFHGYKQKIEHDHLLSEGVEVMGQVQKVEVKSGRRGVSTFWATIEFDDANNKTYSKVVKVSEAFYQANLLGRVRFDDPEPNRSVAMIYWPADPNQSQMKGYESNHNKLLGFGALAGFIALGLLLQPLIGRTAR